MIKRISNHRECTGCSACYSVCPKGAITMKSDDFGFVIPEIDETKCIDCLRCDSVCPRFIDDDSSGRISSWYGWHNDSEVVKNSSSGGAFSALAQSVFEQGGVVFGAVFDTEQKKTIIVSSEGELKKIRKSKYVDSFVGDTFKQVKSLLKEGRKVLYCAAPCQTDGLKKYIGNDNENLLLCDFLCHGVSSSEMLKEHLDALSQKFGSKVSKIDFRPKSMGWDDHSIRINFENGKQYDSHSSLDSYFYGDMYSELMLKESCYGCKYREKHTSDITIGDFWGVFAYNPKINDDTGISLVVANNEKGIKSVKAAEKYMHLEPLEKKYSDYAFYVRDRSKIDEKMSKRNSFLEKCKNQGFESTANATYMNGIGKRKLKVFVKKICLKFGIRRHT